MAVVRGEARTRAGWNAQPAGAGGVGGGREAGMHAGMSRQHAYTQ